LLHTLTAATIQVDHSFNSLILIGSKGSLKWSYLSFWPPFHISQGFPTMAALKYSTSFDEKDQGNTAWLGSCSMGPENNPLIEQLRHEHKFTYENIQQI